MGTNVLGYPRKLLSDLARAIKAMKALRGKPDGFVGTDTDGYATTSHLGSGTASASTVLLGNNTWATGLVLLGSATIDMRTAATTTIYTTPSGVVTRIAFVVVRDPTASLAGGTSYTITGLRAAFSLAGVTTANTGYAAVRAADLVEQVEVAASTVVQLTVTTGSTAAANATLDVFGYTTA